jgi:hypothetical protein
MRAQLAPRSSRQQAWTWIRRLDSLVRPTLHSIIKKTILGIKAAHTSDYNSVTTDIFLKLHKLSFSRASNSLPNRTSLPGRQSSPYVSQLPLCKDRGTSVCLFVGPHRRLCRYTTAPEATPFHDHRTGDLSNFDHHIHLFLRQQPPKQASARRRSTPRIWRRILTTAMATPMARWMPMATSPRPWS